MGKQRRAAHLEDINLIALRAEGYEALLLDADNTLSPWNGTTVSAEVRAWLLEARALGFSPIIVSNASEKRLRPLAEHLDIPFAHRCNKPLPFGLLRAARRLRVRGRHCVMVGDQLLTDMIAGGLAGMATILLNPIDPNNEYEGTRVNRAIEALLVRIFRI